MGTNVNRPRIARFGATNIQPMRGTPSRRWIARIGASTAFSAARPAAAGRSSSECRVEVTIDAGHRAPGETLFRSGLDLLVDVGGNSLQRVVERHLTGDGLPESRNRRIE